jgi:hypothetical protein
MTAGQVTWHGLHPQKLSHPCGSLLSWTVHGQ